MSTSLHRRSSSLASLTSLLSLVTFLSAPAQAQGPATQPVSGTVTDSSGAIVQGCAVQLLDANNTAVTKTTTDQNGRFSFSVAHTGQYVLDVTSPGFAEFKKNVWAGKRSLSISVRLSIPASTESVTVTAAALGVSIDPAQNRNTTNIEADDLTRLPVFDQDYITLLSQFLDSDALGTNGVSLVVNGVEAHGPGVTPSAVKSVKINNNPYSALYSRPGRARLEIETKEGTAEYHGDLNFGFRDAAFDARPAYALLKPPEQRRYFEGNATGPIRGSKHTTFLMSAVFDTTDDQAVVNAATQTGPLHLNVSTPQKHFFGEGRVFHNYGSGDQIWIGYSYEHESKVNQGVGGIALPEAGYEALNDEHEIHLAHTRVLSARFLNQLHILLGHQVEPTISNVSQPAVSVLGAFTAGGAQADAKRTETHLESNDTATLTSARHVLRFGFDVPDLSRRGADDWTNQLGSYTFSSLADYVASSPSTLLLQRGEGHLTFLEFNIAPFVEDTYKLRHNLLLTLGVRYYYQNLFHHDVNNFAPRLGFSYAVGSKRSTVVRGGSGVFYDRTGPRPIADLMHFNGLRLRRYLIAQPEYPLSSALTGLPTSIVQLSPSAHIPYTVQWSVGIEHQLTA
jgi:hypothetical protein